MMVNSIKRNNSARNASLINSVTILWKALLIIVNMIVGREKTYASSQIGTYLALQ